MSAGRFSVGRLVVPARVVLLGLIVSALAVWSIVAVEIFFPQVIK